MSKVALKNGKSARDVGQAIYAAWKDAIDNNSTTIDRVKLKTALDGLLDKTDKGDTDRTIEYDFVFDTNLDATTRLVWIAIPTPDVEKSGLNDTWDKYKKANYDNLPKSVKKTLEKELGEAVLFGCGR
jgi:hypothetical protein